jgi:ribosomal protein S18 acetylase RimI-like enzyme
MATIEEVSIEMVWLLKAVRLRALQDMPSAFGSTFAGESQLTDEEWRKRAAAWSGDGSVCFLAMEDGSPCGIVAGKLSDSSEARFAEVMSMWVAAKMRGTGLAASLVGAVERWAQRPGVDHLRLTVTSSNARAIGFYKKCGFALTGRTEPYPNDAALVEYEMVKPLFPS